MREHEAKIYSQNGEDGILAYILGQIGTEYRTAVEFGAGNGLENNTRLLADLGWLVYWFDFEELQYRPHRCEFSRQILTVDNIVSQFRALGVPTQFDVLSVDVDGNDWHLREAIGAAFRPRVCVMEYNGSFAASDEYVMPRNDNYCWQPWQKQFGASLLSLTQQATRLGYDLVYCESRGVNAFYVRSDINTLPVLSVDEAWRPLWWAQQV